MKGYTLLFIIYAFFFSAFSCSRNHQNQPKDDKKDSTGNVMKPLLPLHAVGTKILDAEGKEFRAWGFNYGIYDAPLLIEQYWDENWQAIVSDFDEMKSYGANCIRLHIQFETFMNNVETPNQHSLDQLKKIFSLSEQKGLYVLLCGTNAYLKNRQPAWYTTLSDSARMITQMKYWEAIANAIGKSNALLGYDLMNEPLITLQSTPDWLQESDGGYGFYFAQFLFRNNPNRASRENIFKFWIAGMTNAIRKYDPSHLITVGLLPFFPEDSKLSGVLDMINTHIYPGSDTYLTGDVNILKSFMTNKPLIISETYPLSCTDVELQSFIKNQNKNVSGWIWHYHGKTIEELEAIGTNVAVTQATAIKKFREMAASQKMPPI